MAIMAAATVATVVARPLSLTLVSRQRPRSVFSPLAYSSSSLSSSSSSIRKLVLYSKPGCCLCDGLKEKLQAAFLLSGSDSLHDVDLQVTHFSHILSLSPFDWAVIWLIVLNFCCWFCQVRDITTNPEWEKAYQYEIPVLARVLSDGTEVIIIIGQFVLKLSYSFVCWFLFQDSVTYTSLSTDEFIIEKHYNQGGAYKSNTQSLH